MRRAFIITLLIALALWLAGCEVVETHYVGRRHGFHSPRPVVIHSRPVYSPPGYHQGGHRRGHGRGW